MTDITERGHVDEAEQEAALLAFALDRVRGAAFLTDDQGRFRYVNEEACRILGYTRAELLGLGVSDIDPEFPVHRWADHWRTLKAQRSLNFESRHRTRDGRRFPVEISANYFEYGGRAYNLGLARDITERKRAEEALRRSEAYLAEAQRLSHAGSWAYDLASDKYVYASEECCRIFELDPQGGLPTREAFARQIHPEDYDKVHREYEKSLREKVDTSIDFRIALPSGAAKHIQAVQHPVLNEAGDVVQLVGTTIDVTERKRAEESLRESEAHLNRAQEIAHIGSWHLDLAGNTLTWSDEVYRIFGMPRGVPLSYEAFLDRVHPEDREGVDRAWKATLQGAPYDIQHRILVGDEVKWVREMAELQFDQHGKAVRGIGTVQDVTERKRSEEEVRNIAAQWQATFDAVQDLVLLLDKDFRILRANRAAAEFLGLPLDRIVEGYCFNLIHGTSVAPADCPLARLRRSRKHEEEEVMARPGGPWLSVSVDPVLDQNGELTQVVHVARDITERKRVEDALRTSEVYLAEGQRLSHTGSWAWDPVTLQTLHWSEEMFRIFGLDPREGVPAAEAFWQRVHPEDLDRTREMLLTAAARSEEYEHDHRIVLPDGTIKHIHAVGHPIRDHDGQVVKFVGTAVDVTERRQSEENTRRAFEEIQRLKAQLEQQNEYLREEVVEARAFGDLVGESAALQKVVSQIDLVAPTDASVLIQGETGTGKELVAHEIHRRSHRQDKPLVRVNCASVPKDLYESEFFGHARGAFTGAIKDRAGRFETAEGGTLFMDEIAEVPLELQGKLLRVLQEKQYERVGEDRTRRADVRIIAATNCDLRREVEAGRFREDLYYRLNVFPIHVAPLRDRKDDIPLLAQHFVQRSVTELRCPRARLTRAEVVRLQSYDWPGNIRELRNAIERAVILARGGVLRFDLPICDAPPAARTDGSAADDGPGFLTEVQLRQRERENLLAVLEKTGWKVRGVDGAAELLGVKATTLLSRMKAMGIQRPQ